MVNKGHSDVFFSCSFIICLAFFFFERQELKNTVITVIYLFLNITSPEAISLFSELSNHGLKTAQPNNIIEEKKMNMKYFYWTGIQISEDV